RRLRILTNKEGSTKRQFGREGLWKLPQPWKSIAVAFGNLLLIIPIGCLKKPTQKTRLFHSYAQARRRLINNRRKGNRSGALHENASCLTEAIHFGNDVHSSVASLRLLDALR